MGLLQIEHQLMRHAQAERRRWQEIAALLMQVDKERLWEAQAPSFTAWLQGMARRADLQESVFWRCLKAGRIYLELSGRDSLDTAPAVSAESLELADKIRRHAPKAVGNDVLTRTLEGDLSRTELRQVWTTYKAAAGGTTDRGRLPNDPQDRAGALEAKRAQWESEKRKPENRAEVRRGELLAAFRSFEWLGTHDQARSETRVHGLTGRLAAVSVVRRDAAASAAVEVHGLWTCVSRPELADYEYAAPAGIDFMWLAFPDELSEHVSSRTPRLLGLLTMKRKDELCVLRLAQRRRVDAAARCDVLAWLLTRAYLWP